MDEAVVPIPLAPPLRPFRPVDAPVAARLNDMASGGIVERVWQQKVGPDGDLWAHGAKRQIARMTDGHVIIVVDPGRGVEAVMSGYPLGLKPQGLEGVEPVFHPLVELENLVLGSWYVNVLGTIPEARRRGHGRRLMVAAEAVARAGGHAEITLIAHDANDEALGLYNAQGYRERTRRPMVNSPLSAGHPGRNWILLGKRIG